MQYQGVSAEAHLSYSLLVCTLGATLQSLTKITSENLKVISSKMDRSKAAVLLHSAAIVSRG
jgi:hypothetical protein